MLLCGKGVEGEEGHGRWCLTTQALQALCFCLAVHLLFLGPFVWEPAAGKKPISSHVVVPLNRGTPIYTPKTILIIGTPQNTPNVGKP